MATGNEFKVVLAGQFGTGKTSFATRIKAAKANSKEIKALKTTQYPVKLQTSAGQVTLNLFDTNLHAKGGIPDDGFFRTADAAIVFFDLTSEDSYSAMEEWYDAVIKANGRKGSEPLPIVVVGTKADDIKASILLHSGLAHHFDAGPSTWHRGHRNALTDRHPLFLSFVSHRAESSSQKLSSSPARRSARIARSLHRLSEYSHTAA